MMQNVIAIDGPAGAGKSTVAKKVAQKLGFVYIDTGAMYRAVTCRAIDLAIGISDEVPIGALAENIDIRITQEANATRVWTDGVDVTEKIRSPEVTSAVSKVAQFAAVRDALVRLQREMAAAGKVVLDGRDIGTVVVPDACLKIYLTASADERAKRRWLEMKAKGYDPDFEELQSEIEERDHQDSMREIAPLVPAPDAVWVDTTGLAIEAVAVKIVDIYHSRCDDV